MGRRAAPSDVRRGGGRLGLLAACLLAGASAHEDSSIRVLGSGGAPGTPSVIFPAAFGPHLPFNTDLDKAVAAAEPRDGCGPLTTSADALRDAIAVFDLPGLGACDPAQAAARAAEKGAAVALFVSRDDSLRPLSLGRATEGSPAPTIPLMIVGKAFGDGELRGASRARIHLVAAPLADGAAVRHAIPADGLSLFAYEHQQAGSFALHVFASEGDPDLYVNGPAALDALTVPGDALTAQYSSEDLGDDLLTVPGAAAGTYLVAVKAFAGATNFTIRATSEGSEAVMALGEPLRLDVPEGAYRFLRLPGEAGGARVFLTTLAGRARVWACSTFVPRPGGDDACAVAADAQGTAALDLGSPAAGAAVHLVVLGMEAAAVTLAAAMPGSPIALVDGTPQGGLVSAGNPSGTYTLRAPQEGTVEVTVRPQGGTVRVTLTEVGGGEWPVPAEEGYHLSLPVGAGGVCAGCDLELRVARDVGDVSEIVPYTATVSTSQGIVTLEDGVPHVDAVARGALEHFRVRVSDAATDLEVVLTPTSGNPDLYVSHVHRRPNATHHEFASTTTSRDTVVVTHGSAAMRDCASHIDTVGCSFFITVEGVTNCTFTITASVSVVDSGLRIDSPERLAGRREFSNAVFGPPLPFDAISREVAAVEPPDACADLTSGPLDGKIALVDRGECFFTEKVRRIQAKMASAVIVINTEEGSPIRMGIPAGDDGDEVAIPAVMVSKEDGAALRGALAAGEPVRATLQQPGDRPVALADGAQQRGSVDTAELRFYSFTPPAGTTNLTITLTPESGDPDLYVANDGLPPTTTHFGWTSAYSGADTVTINAGEALFCAPCAYLIGVYGFRASNYTLVAATGGAATALEWGVPLQSTASEGQTRYFTLAVSDATQGLRVILTPMTGDVDLYLSMSSARPSVDDYEWQSARYGADTITINHHDPHYHAGLLHIGVRGFTNSSFSLTAARVDDADITLLDGRPQALSLDEGSQQLLSFAVDAGAANVTIAVTATVGDPDFYVTTDGRLPSPEDHDFAGAHLGSDSLRVSRARDDKFCAGCEWLILVRAWTAFNATVVATAGFADGAEGHSGLTMLQEGVPVESQVSAGEYQDFAFTVDREDAKVVVTVTAVDGDPDIYARFHDARPRSADATWRAVAIGGDHVSISRQDPAFCRVLPCTLFIAVHGSTASRFSIVASQREDSVVTLVDGKPQWASLATGDWQYFAYTAPQGATLVRFGVSAGFGDPDVYVSVGPDAWPTAQEGAYTWKAEHFGGEQVVITDSDPNWETPPAVYHVGVLAFQAANFSITASGSGTQTLLEDGVPVVSEVPPGAYELYRLHVDEPEATDVEVALTPFSGNADLYLGITPSPTKEDHRLAAEGNRSDVIVVDHEGATMADCRASGRECVLHVAVYGVGDAPARYAVSASLKRVNRGLEVVSAPASAQGVAGQYENRPASFGPPLTFEGVQGPLKQAQPYSACEPLQAGSLSGRVALVERGFCLFTAKVRHAQDAGAVAVVVANNVSEPEILTMIGGTGGDEDAAAVAIPALMIAKADGDRLRGALAVGEVTVRLRQSGDRPRMLIDGLPYAGHLGPRSEAFYKLYVGEGHGDVSFSLTPSSGYATMYVSADGLPPTYTHYGWRGSSVVSVHTADEGACTDCHYTVGVYTYGGANFTLTGTSSRAATTLLLGEPAPGQLAAGGWEYYRVDVAQHVAWLSVQVTPSEGDPDLYVSQLYARPNKTTHDARSERYGADTVVLEDFAPGPLFIGVTAFSNTSFTIVATDASAAVTTLVDGAPQMARLRRGAWAYFRFSPGEGAVGVSITCTPVFGDPDLYVSNDGHVPTTGAYGWKSALLSYETVTVAASDPQFCAACDYLVGVYAFTDSSFAVQATADRGSGTDEGGEAAGHTLLRNGVPVLRALRDGQVAYFRHDMVRTDTTVTVRVSTLSGASDFYGAFAEPYPSAASHQWAAAGGAQEGQRAFSVSFADSPCSATPCPSYYTVAARGNTTFTVLASRRLGGNVTLVNGVPQSGELPASAWAYYLARAPANATWLSLAVTATYGDPDVYVRVDEPPTASESDWHGFMEGGEAINITAADSKFRAPATYHIGVYARTATRYQVVASVQVAGANETAVTLLDGEPLAGAIVGMGNANYYRFLVDRSDTAVRLQVTPLSGDPDLLASFAVSHPEVGSTGGYVWTSSRVGGDALTISHFDPHFCPSVPCELHVAVKAFSEQASYTLVARQAEEGILTLVDGMPQAGSLAAGDSQLYSFAKGPDAPSVRFTLTPVAGDPDLYVSRSPAYPTRTNATWVANTAGTDTLAISSDDPNWCPGACAFNVRVHGWRATNYTLTASTGERSVTLQDGMPYVATARAGSAEYFSVRVASPNTDLDIVVTPVAGDPDVYVSHLTARPNASSHEFASRTDGMESVSVPRTAEEMVACTHAAVPCAFFVAVVARGNASATFSIAASLSRMDSGFTVDAPARLAGSRNFSDATFGPPLPFHEGAISRPVAVVEPADACGELTSPSLEGKIALVDRGVCRFVDKVVHAHARGASAVVVANDVEGEPVRMGLPSDLEAEASYDIPAVMISKADGLELRAAIVGGEEVRVTLQQPGDRPAVLVAGLPQHGFVGERQLRLYQFRMGPERAAVTFSLTPETGDPDMFVSNDGLPPTTTHFQWTSRRLGADSIVVASDDPKACASCDYYVGVYGYSRFAASNYTLTVSLEGGITTLRDGVARAASLPAGGTDYYQVFVTDVSQGVRVAVTPLSGDPDLYVSMAHRRPNATHHTWGSASLGVDAVNIAPGDPNLRVGTLHIAATAPAAASYLISARLDRAASLSLASGSPEQGLSPSGEWSRYTFTVDANATVVSFEVTPSFGDPDMYVRVGAPPTAAEHTWEAGESGGDVLVIRRSTSASCDPAAAWCAARNGEPTVFHVGVLGWTTTQFTLTAIRGEDLETDFVRLMDGIPTVRVLPANRTATFFLVATSLFRRTSAKAAVVVLTPYSGEALLSAAFGNSSAVGEGSRSAATDGARGVTLTIEPRPQCARGAFYDGFYEHCYLLYARVTARTDCTFAIRAAADEAGQRTMLSAGRPQYGSLAQGRWAYYTFSAHHAAGMPREAFTVALMPQFGDPNLYVAPQRLPSRSDYGWRAVAAGADHLLVDSEGSEAGDAACEPDGNGGGGEVCTYGVGVFAESATNFSISVYTHGSTVVLQEGSPLTAVAPAGECRRFVLLTGATSGSLRLSLTPLSGAPAVYVGAEANPGSESHLPGGAFEPDDLQGEAVVNASSLPNRAFYISVCDTGLVSRSSRFVIAARLRVDAPLLLDGQPYAGTVRALETARFRVSAGAHATRMQVVASPEGGDVALLLSPMSRMAGTGSADEPGWYDRAVWRSDVPGANTITARATDEGWCAGCDYAVGVVGKTAANFTLLVTVDRAYTLRDGEPQTAQLARYAKGDEARAAYFSYSVDEAVGFTVVVTVLMGNPSVYMSTSNSRPSGEDYTWRPPVGSSFSASGIRRIHVPPSDPDFCSGCTYFLGVVAYGNCSVAVTAWLDTTEALRLRDGLALKDTAPAGVYKYYTFSMAEAGGELRVSARPELGGARVALFANAGDSPPSEEEHHWPTGAAGAARAGDQGTAILIRPADRHYCAPCTYTVAVRAERATTFTVVATTEGGSSTLLLGLPSLETIPMGATAFYQTPVDPEGGPVTVSALPAHGAVHVTMSTLVSRPSDEFNTAAFDARSGRPARYRVPEATLAEWCRAPARASGVCALYLGVRSLTTDGGDVVLAVSQGGVGMAQALLPGIPVAAAAGDGELLHFALTVGPEHADVSVSVSVAPPAGAWRAAPPPAEDKGGHEGADAADTGADADTDAGGEPKPPSGEACGFPELSVWVSRDKVPEVDKDAQWAAVAEEASAGVGVVYIDKDDRRACTECTYHVTVRARCAANLTVVASSPRGHTLLAEGMTTGHDVREGEYEYFSAFLDRDCPEHVLITVEPCLGNPDLFVSDVTPYPGLPPLNYTFASRQTARPERILIQREALESMEGDRFYVGVLGETRAKFTIRTEAAESAGGDDPFAVAASQDASAVPSLDRLTARSVAVSWDPLPAELLAGEPPRGVTYRLYAAREETEGGDLAVLYTACGLAASGDRVAEIRVSAEEAAEPPARGYRPLSATVEGLRPGTVYLANVAAMVDGRDKPYIYRQVSFTTLEGGAGRGWAIAAMVLATLLACTLCTVGALIHRRRRQLRDGSLLADDGAVDMQSFVASPLTGGGLPRGGEDDDGEGGVVPLVAPAMPASLPPAPPVAAEADPAPTAEAEDPLPDNPFAVAAGQAAEDDDGPVAQAAIMESDDEDNDSPGASDPLSANKS